MKHFFNACRVAVCCLLFFTAAGQQGADALWLFGEYNVVDFGPGSPVVAALPNTGGGPPYYGFYFSGAVCDRGGSPLFWGKIFNTMNTAQFVLYDRSGQAMPNGQLLAGGTGRAVPVIVPDPGDTNRYYFCYLRNATLRYSLIDLRLHGGLGDVMPGQKDVQLGKAGSLADRKLLAVPGCAGVWLVVRARVRNEYYSYRIGPAGVDTAAVASACGLLPVNSYGDVTEYSGILKAANGGGKIVAACSGSIPDLQVPGRRRRLGGLELYDFEPCTGVLSHPVVLDTGYYYGAAFSPDNSKLYATRIYERTLYQFDLSLPTIAAAAASKTLVLTNPDYGTLNEESYLLGDIKAGKDGRMYLGNNKCADYPFTNALHVITRPNAAGAACAPVLNGFPLPMGSGSCTGLNLPAEIVYAPQQDTVYEPEAAVPACFRDSLLLAADTAGRCFRWEDGFTGPARTVHRDSVYRVRYTDGDCRLHYAAYRVSFTQLHPATGGSYACPGAGTGTAFAAPAARDTALLRYQWTRAGAPGVLLREHTGRTGDTLRGLDTGTYTVRVSSANGCDTVFALTVQAIPRPVASCTVDTVVCLDAPVTFTCTSAVPLCRWTFAQGEVYRQRSVTRSFPIASTYTVVLVVQNAEGCTDTLAQRVEVIAAELSVTADRDEVGIGEQVQLLAHSPEPFSVLAWDPAGYGLPPVQDPLVRMDSTTRFVVTGRTDQGCTGQAEVTVRVRPVVLVPTAFSPNGDGRNDRFRVRSAGDGIFVRHFAVYDRWGELVWNGYGAAAQEGWDGNRAGKACAGGVYFYLIEGELRTGKGFVRKGDVTLVR